MNMFQHRIYKLITAMQLTEAQIQANIDLVKWQHLAVKKSYPLTTIHSLLIDGHPKFEHLRQLVQNFNQETAPKRIKLKQSFIQRLFGLLSQLTRIPIAEQQLEFLNKIYKWAVSEQRRGEQDYSNTSKSRPGTASTRPRTRALSAYSRPATGRPISGINPTNSTKRQNQQLQVKMQMKRQQPSIDYDKLQPGDQQFYAGIRTLHSEIEPPKKRLKEYQRKKFYEEDSDQDIQIIDYDKEKLPNQVPMTQDKLIQEIEAAQQEGEGDVPQGQGQAVDPLGVNIDDIPLEGQQEGGQQLVQEEKEVIDKLRPKIKAYAQSKAPKFYNKRQYEDGHAILRKQRNTLERTIQEDIELASLQAKWAQSKARTKSEAKRRVQSARLTTVRLGVTNQVQDLMSLEKDIENIIHLQNYNPTEVNGKPNRPVTAFTASSKRAKQQSIKNAFITSRLSGHISKYQPTVAQNPTSNQLPTISMTRWGAMPKKKTFQQILRQAEEKVMRQAEEEVLQVKEVLAKNKVGIGATRIARSITFNQKQVAAQNFVGQITGMAMIKNPFIKVAKKKKKKKSKK